MQQDRAPVQPMFELLIVISWSSPYMLLPNTWTVRALGGYFTLPLYAIKWCETTSHFLGRGKKIAWTYWQNTPGLTETLLALINEPPCSSLSTYRSWNDLCSKWCVLAKVNEQSNGARQHHISLDAASWLLGHIGKRHQVSLKHWWHWKMNHHDRASPRTEAGTICVVSDVFWLRSMNHHMVRDNITLPWMWQDDCLDILAKEPGIIETLVALIN